MDNEEKKTEKEPAFKSSEDAYQAAVKGVNPEDRVEALVFLRDNLDRAMAKLTQTEQTIKEQAERIDKQSEKINNLLLQTDVSPRTNKDAEKSKADEGSTNETVDELIDNTLNGGKY